MSKACTLSPRQDPLRVFHQKLALPSLQLWWLCLTAWLPNLPWLPGHRTKSKLLSLEVNIIHYVPFHLIFPSFQLGAFPPGHRALSKATSTRLNPLDLFTGSLGTGLLFQEAPPS